MKTSIKPNSTKAQILSVAQEALQEHPMSEITLSHISHQLGLGHTAIYKHFDSKQSLWTAVGTQWFFQTIVEPLQVMQFTKKSQKTNLKEWLWTFITLKHQSYFAFPNMAEVTIAYIDNDPYILKELLESAYQQIDAMMDYQDSHHERAQAIMSAFTLFTIPLFRVLWEDQHIKDQFNQLWKLIEPGL